MLVRGKENQLLDLLPSPEISITVLPTAFHESVSTVDRSCRNQVLDSYDLLKQLSKSFEKRKCNC